jgi:hopanoid biosynthesis associated protein HpnK
VKQLIVNADDFGLTENVNNGIWDSHCDGIVTSTTLLANGMAFEDAAAEGKRIHELGIGVHLNLTEGKPVADAKKIPTLVDRGGRLHMAPARLWAGIAAGQVSLSDIETEFRAQVTKIFHAGIRPTHFDGHKHVHVLPRVSEVVIRLAREFHIPAVRCPEEQNSHAGGTLVNGRHSGLSALKQSVVSRAVSLMAGSFRTKLARAGLLSSTHFFGISRTGFLDADAIRQILENLPEGTSELMCHPGYHDVDLERSGTRLLTEREIEIQGLTATSVRNLVESTGIQLLNYGEFVESTQPAWVAA